jgi:hypothetical protein
VATTAHWAIEGYNSDMGALFLGEQTQHARGDGSAAMGRGPRREHVTGEGGRTTCCKRRGRASRLLAGGSSREGAWKTSVQRRRHAYRGERACW